jgi:hypothetical protein
MLSRWWPSITEVGKQLLDPYSYDVDLAGYVVDLHVGGGSGGSAGTVEGRLRWRQARV